MGGGIISVCCVRMIALWVCECGSEVGVVGGVEACVWGGGEGWVPGIIRVPLFMGDCCVDGCGCECEMVVVGGVKVCVGSGHEGLGVGIQSECCYLWMIAVWVGGEGGGEGVQIQTNRVALAMINKCV